ncbi:hypothetical protein EMLAB_30190 [Enterococcus mundtii]|nr:hypothetical protein EMLAB_30190 [Enterococcus mundtii]
MSPVKIDNPSSESFCNGESVKYRKMVLQGSIPCQRLWEDLFNTGQCNKYLTHNNSN